MRNRRLSVALGLAWALLPITAWAATVRTPHVEAELVSEARSIAPGRTVWVALRLDIIPHWHTYWSNPGDSGLATEIRFDLEPGLEVGPIHWPHPRRIEAGTLVSYGYEGEVLHLIPITATDELAAETTTLRAHASWLVCDEVCLPEEAELELDLVVDGATVKPDPRWTERFAAARASLPLEDAGWSFEAWRGDHSYVVRAAPPDWLDGRIELASFFPAASGVVDDDAAQEWRFDPESGQYWLKVARASGFADEPDALRGVLVGSDGWRGPGGEPALAIAVPITADVPPPVSTDIDATPPPAAALAGGAGASTADAIVGDVVAHAGVALGLLGAVGFALAGGLLLNLMPCVFPVVSLKVMGFVHHAQSEHSRPWKHGLAFAGGVILSFWVVAGSLLLLRAAGAEIGWGFQLQAPAVLVCLAALFFLLGLNLFGVFEMGTSLTRLEAQADRVHGLGSSFLSGCLATVVATPCSAPFMGAALGFALVQPALPAMLVFTALGVGMALPYVVLASSPRLLRRIPRPGPWMESLRQAMGFGFLATVIWLGWVLERQAGPGAVVSLLGVLWLLGLAGWIAGRWGALVRRLPVRIAARVVAVALIAVGLGVAWRDIVSPSARAAWQSSGGGSAAHSDWIPFSEERVGELRSEGHPVFIDFTAAWCLSCQVNKQVALDTAGVRARFDALGVARVEADWTNRDSEITRALARFGRSGVPLYVLYGRDPGAEPELLPAVLTPGVVLEALERAAG